MKLNNNFTSQLTLTLLGILVWTFTTSINAETVLITGSNRGIGYEFAVQYAEKGWDVIATHRRDKSPQTLIDLQKKYSTIRIEYIDVTKTDSIKAAADKLKDVPIDVLINNAGWPGRMMNPSQQFGTLDYEEFFTVLDSMTAGVMRVTEAFFEHVKASKHKTVTIITSETGSFHAARTGHTPLGRAYWLGTSKAAINFLFAKMSYQFRDDGVIFLMLDPGLVRDTNEEAWRKARGEDIHQFVRLPGMPGRVDIGISVAGMIKVTDAATIEDSGRVFSYTGEQQED